MVVTGTLLMNKDTIFLCASLQLHPERGFFHHLGVCELPRHIVWVMKGYRKQPETWYWRRVVISDITRPCKLGGLYHLCYDNRI